MFAAIQDMAVQRLVAPTILPVTIEQAKRRCGIYDDDSVNQDVRDWIIEATDRVETDSRRMLMTQTWQGWLDDFPCHGSVIELRKWPVQSVTHVKYYTGGVLTTWSSAYYQVDTVKAPSRLYPVSGQQWPTVDSDKMNAVEVQWIAGCTTQAQLKQQCPRAQTAVLLYVEWLFKGGCFPGHYEMLINSIKRLGFVT